VGAVGGEDGRHTDVARVGAGLGLGEGIGPDSLPAGDRSQELLFLLLGAVAEEAVAVERVADGHDDRVGSVHPGDLFQRQDVGQCVHPHAAILFRHLNAHKALCAHLFNRLVGELARLVKVGGDRRDLLLAKVPRHVTDHTVFVAEMQVHRDSSLIMIVVDRISQIKFGINLG